ncbi:MAG TPA: hypothetical protein VGI40_09875 [Pirellulaceae bacterium]|jgi:hypothetical protein
MRRVVYEWGLIAAVAMGVAAVAVWGVSLCSPATLFHLHAWPRAAGSLHLLVRQGDLWLCDGVDNGPSGGVRAVIVGPPVATDYQRGDRLRRFHVPGLDFQYYWLAPWRNTVWSIKVSLLIPAAIFLLAGVMLYRRLKRLRWVAVVLPAKARVHVLDRADV